MTVRNRSPIIVCLLGVGVVVITWSANLIGIGDREKFDMPQTIWALSGGGLLLTGLVLDWTVGKRYTEKWLKQLALDKQSMRKFLSIVIQLGLLVLVTRHYKLENAGFYRNIMYLTFAGFIIHYFLPLGYRLPFFLLLSLAGILTVFGVANGTWFIGMGLVLISLCHLPVPFFARVVALITAGVVLAAARVGWLVVPWSEAILPILASMFMFRLIVYLYDLKHQREQTSVSHTLAYFFLLPNVVFPLFPVVDYKTFRRTHYDTNQHQVYQTGVKWMFHGVVHVLLYRCVNYYLVISPADVANVSNLVQYMVSNFLLILRLSGMFYMSIGVLHLFGFNLPEPMHFYYLASSSFTDFWRRANIYWKDFMQKVFFYPVYFRLRKLSKTKHSAASDGTAIALLLSTLFVFFVTWFFHAYQWFWIRGTFLLSAPDVLFWVFFGVLVAINCISQ